jgi:hypothetical protein
MLHNNGPRRWDDNAKRLLASHIESGEIDISNVDRITPDILDFYNEEYFSEYCDLSNRQRKHQARKRLKNALANYETGIHLPRRIGKLTLCFPL